MVNTVETLLKYDGTRPKKEIAYEVWNEMPNTRMAWYDEKSPLRYLFDRIFTTRQEFQQWVDSREDEWEDHEEVCSGARVWFGPMYERTLKRKKPTKAQAKKALRLAENIDVAYDNYTNTADAMVVERKSGTRRITCKKCMSKIAPSSLVGRGRCPCGEVLLTLKQQRAIDAAWKKYEKARADLKAYAPDIKWWVANRAPDY